MIASLTCCLMLTMSQQGGQLVAKTTLPIPPGGKAQLWFTESKDPMDPPQNSPKKFGEPKMPWMFPWFVGGFSHIIGDPSNDELRFRIFAQEQRGGKQTQVARMLLRLWEFNVERMNLIHNPNYHRGLVDVYLCFGGRAGGEQLFDEELVPDPKRPEVSIPYKANTIYIYDMPSFTDPVEMAREVAHEYGHATWPPVGGFKDPEEWSDGYLAERVFLRWLRDALAANILTTDDTMGATKAGLDKWLATNLDPLMLKAAQTEPTEALLSDKSAVGMNAFLGLATYINAIYPDNIPRNVFSRSLMLTGYNAKEYLNGAVLAAEEPDRVTLRIPPQFIRKAIWLPLGTGKLTGAPILKKNASGWVQVQVGANPIVITNTH